MVFIAPPLEELANESDVEQKLVMPFLTGDQPYGLGIPTEKIHTKANIRRFQIGKGSDGKVYFPDYLVVEAGFPLLVIEAKSPGENLNQAFREARLYATELNAIYPAELNPLKKIIATDGTRFIAGTWDQSTPEIDVPHAEFGAQSKGMGDLQAFCCYKELMSDFAAAATSSKQPKYFKPRRLLGSVVRQHEEVAQNTFGSTVSADFAHIFNPSTIEDRKNIAINGYIPSRRRERYIDPIDRVIRAARTPSSTDSILLDDTSKPKELIEALNDTKPLIHQVLLIVGSVGVGKSTFVDNLQYVSLPESIRKSTLWLRIDMNPAPIAANEIYNWVRKQIIKGCQDAIPDIDFENLEAIKSVFSVEVNRFAKGIGKLYNAESTIYREKLAEELSSIMSDQHLSAIAYTRYCATERGKLPIIVLDNCDKRTRDEQLLLFEVSQWVQKEFRCLVVLPLRDETYDNYRDKPPLDTALKDLVFRIEPPLFHNVLIKRVQLALNELREKGDKVLRYELPNGFHVDYPATDKAYFLRAIVYAVFNYDRHIRRMIIGLAGRNIRRALEIFSDFCTSGHISEDYIFRITNNKGDYLLPLHLVMRILLRGNRRFYDNDFSYVKNILAMDARDTHPSYFSRIAILKWLFNRFHLKEPSSLKGYFSIRSIAADLSKYGIESTVVLREVMLLAKAVCIVTEDFSVDGLSFEDHIRLAPAGFVQLEMLSSVDFAAAVAEDTWFEQEENAKQVRDRIYEQEEHYKATTAVDNARVLLEQLNSFRKRELKAIETVFESNEFENLTDLSELETAISKLETSITPSDWQDIDARYQVGQSYNGTIVNVQTYGVFVELEAGISGLLHRSKMPNGYETLDELSIGEMVTIKILVVDRLKQRIEMSLES